MVLDQINSPKQARQFADEFLKVTLKSYPKDRFEGRGIVICGGGAKYFTNAWVCVSILRQHGCQLPIQLWYLGPEEVDYHMQYLMSQLDVECVDGYEIREKHPARILNGWELKAFAMLHSPFEEVMLVDADNVAVRNPDFLFDDPHYLNTGAVFWPDYGRLARSRMAWEVFGVEYRDEPEFETGQALVHKEKCWEAMNLTMFYNEHSDYYYHHVHGDKETFHMAWRRLGQEYSMPPYPIHSLYATMCQHDFEGNRLFQHRNMAKWTLSGDNPNIRDFWLEEECLAHLETLRSQWNGMVVKPKKADHIPYDPKGRDLFREVCSYIYEYRRIGHDKRPMRLSPRGDIGLGRGGEETRWSLKKDGDGHVLTIGNASQAICHLRRDPDGIWRGQWLRHEQMPIELAPMSQPEGFSTLGHQVPLPWDEFVKKLVEEAIPMSQNTSRENLGFGYLYYSLVRNIRPDTVVVIGSAKGFSTFAAARGLQENGYGKLYFIDPGYEGMGHPGWSGLGHWNDAKQVKEWIASFRLEGWVEHLKMTSNEAIEIVRKKVENLETGLVIIDGDHTASGSMSDFRQYGSLIREGMVCFHDATNPHCGVQHTLRQLKKEGYDMTILPQDAGLAMVTVKRKWKFEEKWNYLAENQERGAQLYQKLASVFKKGDVVMDMYCGSAPLAEFLNEQSVFGWDIDADQILNLKSRLPDQRWEIIPEQLFPYADLPAQVDVLMGLGILGHQAEWDPLLAAKNITLAIKMFKPRAIILEAAANYTPLNILDELIPVLQSQGYNWHNLSYTAKIDHFTDRRLIIGRRLED